MKKSKAVFMTLAVGLAAVIGTAANASADPMPASGSNAAPTSSSECPAYNLCLWKNADYNPTPPWSADYFSEPSNMWLPVSTAMGNNASSLWNYRDLPARVAQFHNGTGLIACIPAGEWYDNLADWYWAHSSVTMNDSITSYEFLDSGPCVAANEPQLSSAS